MIPKTFCPFCGNSLKKKYIEDRLRLFCKVCEKPYYENPIPATAAVVINENSEVLLVKRKVVPHKGKWCLPGGFIEINEEPEDCCLRELKEETNLRGEIGRLIGVYLSGHPTYKSVVVVGYSISRFKGKIKPGDDSDEVRFFNLEKRPPLAFKSHESILESFVSDKKVKKKIFSKKTINLDNFGAYVITSNNHVDIAEKASRAGARIIQYRDKTSTKKDILENAVKIRKITEKNNALFIVNDYVDIAFMSNADGVHLGQDDISISDAREMAPDDFIIGRSTHSLEQALEAQKQEADYIAIGPVFATPTKKDYPPISMDVVREVAEAVEIPIVAIGGLNPGNIPELMKIGIRNFAMVRAIQKNTEEVVKKINNLLKKASW